MKGTITQINTLESESTGHVSYSAIVYFDQDTPPEIKLGEVELSQG